MCNSNFRDVSRRWFWSWYINLFQDSWQKCAKNSWEDLLTQMLLAVSRAELLPAVGDSIGFFINYPTRGLWNVHQDLTHDTCANNVLKNVQIVRLTKNGILFKDYQKNWNGKKIIKHILSKLYPIQPDTFAHLPPRYIMSPKWIFWIKPVHRSIVQWA